MSNAPLTIELPIQGMHCINCAQGLEKQLKKIGATDVEVSFGTSSARLALGPSLSLEQVVHEIERLGYQVPSSTNRDQSSQPQGLHFLKSTLAIKFFFCLFWTTPLLLAMFFPPGILHSQKLQLLLSTPVFLVGLHYFGKSALASLRTGVANMDVLIIVGVVASFAYSLVGLILGLGHEYLFFETSATIVTIVLLGNLLEQISVEKTSSAIRELGRLQVQKAKKVTGDTVTEVAVSEIALQDILLVNQGDRIPVDGTVSWGTGSVDEAMISGESIPQDKEVGSKLIAGTLLIQGTLKMLTHSIGADTVLAQMIRLVQDAQRHKPRLQRLGDAVSAVFVPAVIVICILAIFANAFILDTSIQEALLRGIAVLVIACPCALGLATPTAVMVGVGDAARKGILIKGGSTLETFAKIKTLIFDKTGTLTTGHFKIRSLQVIGIPEEEARSILLGLEQHSSHPIATSITRELSGTQAYTFKQIEEMRGFGMKGQTLSGKIFTVCASQKLAELGIPHSEISKSADLVLLRNNEIVAAIEIEDQLKPEAQQTIKTLQTQGFEIILLSGDSEKKVQNIASKLGIQKNYSQMSPEQKVTIVRDLSAKSITAYVGDGINDAAALSSAHIGVSLSNASAAAIQSAHVILLNGRLDYVLEAISIAQATVRVIKQNLFWAFFYNVIAIPMAAFGLLSPMLAALSMACSDLVVIANSLRMRLQRGTARATS